MKQQSMASTMHLAAGNLTGFNSAMVSGPVAPPPQPPPQQLPMYAVPPPYYPAYSNPWGAVGDKVSGGPIRHARSNPVYHQAYSPYSTPCPPRPLTANQLPSYPPVNTNLVLIRGLPHDAQSVELVEVFRSSSTPITENQVSLLFDHNAQYKVAYIRFVTNEDAVKSVATMNGSIFRKLLFV